MSDQDKITLLIEQNRILIENTKAILENMQNYAKKAKKRTYVFPDGEEWITFDEARAILKVSNTTLHAMRRDKRIVTNTPPTGRNYKYSKNSCLKYLREKN